MITKTLSILTTIALLSSAASAKHHTVDIEMDASTVTSPSISTQICQGTKGCFAFGATNTTAGAADLFNGTRYLGRAVYSTSSVFLWPDALYYGVKGTYTTLKGAVKATAGVVTTLISAPFAYAAEVYERPVRTLAITAAVVGGTALVATNPWILASAAVGSLKVAAGVTGAAFSAAGLVGQGAGALVSIIPGISPVGVGISTLGQGLDCIGGALLQVAF